MIEIESNIEGKHYSLYKLEQTLKPKGYTIGGNWEYDRGFFDYKMGNDNGYQFLRIPFFAVDGQLDSHNTTVKFGRPFVLSHVYQSGIDETANISNVTAAFNQFQQRKIKMQRLRKDMWS